MDANCTFSFNIQSNGITNNALKYGPKAPPPPPKKKSNIEIKFKNKTKKEKKKKIKCKKNKNGVPGWLSQLNVQLLILGQVVILGL